MPVSTALNAGSPASIGAEFRRGAEQWIVHNVIAGTEAADHLTRGDKLIAINDAPV